MNRLRCVCMRSAYRRRGPARPPKPPALAANLFSGPYQVATKKKAAARERTKINVVGISFAILAQSQLGEIAGIHAGEDIRLEKHNISKDIHCQRRAVNTGETWRRTPHSAFYSLEKEGRNDIGIFTHQNDTVLN